ncbi:UNVERIFIED_CONTAM: hypothetical protein K2H54_044798 [Gekko kuhli]
MTIRRQSAFLPTLIVVVLVSDDDGVCQAEFETDERLNLLSVTVLGLRMIFLKTVALNLLLTFRLWSC